MLSYLHYGTFIRFTHPRLQFIENGGSKTEAAKLFKVGRTAIYRWLNTHTGQTGSHKTELLDPTALAEHVKAHPDQTLKERAQHFGVSPACVGYGLKRLGYTQRLDIRSNVQKNDKPIRSNSQEQKHQAKR